MDWKTMLAYVTGSVDEELLRRNEYLVAENRILRAQLPGRVTLSDGERRTLAEIGKRLGRQALAQVASIVRPETILAWHRRLVAKKFDGSERRTYPGRPRVGQEIEQLIVRFATDNRDWGYDRIAGAGIVQTYRTRAAFREVQGRLRRGCQMLTEGLVYESVVDFAADNPRRGLLNPPRVADGEVVPRRAAGQVHPVLPTASGHRRSAGRSGSPAAGAIRAPGRLRRHADVLRKDAASPRDARGEGNHQDRGKVVAPLRAIKSFVPGITRDNSGIPGMPTRVGATTSGRPLWVAQPEPSSAAVGGCP